MEKRVHWNEEAGLSGEMSVSFDIATGEIRCYGGGFWSPAQTVAFFDDWKDIVRRIHAADRSVSALVDMSDSHVQKAEVADIVATSAAGLYRDGDAIAMLVPSSLAKMQMRRVLDNRFHNFFLSRNAATTWLDARATTTRRPLLPHG